MFNWVLELGEDFSEKYVKDKSELAELKYKKVNEGAAEMTQCLKHWLSFLKTGAQVPCPHLSSLLPAIPVLLDLMPFSGLLGHV